MRALLALMMTFTAEAKKPKPAPAPPPAPAVEAPAPAPAPEPEPEPEPVPVVPPDQRPKNATFFATITWADGSVTKGQVQRVERSEDWYAEQGWTDEEPKLKVNLTGSGTEIDAPWTNLSTLTIVYGSPADADCTNDSSFEPAMYMCVLRNTATAKTRDGKSWEVTDRHKWLFVFTTGQVAEFYVSKLPARKPDDSAESESMNASVEEQETRLYGSLQDELSKMRVGKVPKAITISVQ